MLTTSVIIPCYNVQEYLGEALESVCQQTVPAKEIVVIDDGSRIPIRLPENWAGPAIKLIRTANRGVAAARNRGITHCTGDLIAFLDADDYWHPRKIEKQTEGLQHDARAVASYTRCEDRPGFFGFGPYPPSDISDEEFLLVLWYNAFFPPSSVVARREVLLACGGFNERVGNGEDVELCIRLLEHGSFVFIDEPLTSYRKHPQQFTQNTTKKILGGKQARAVVIARQADMLTRAGVPHDRLWDAYRNDILLVYYRRQFASARTLLWDFWREHPADWQVLKYALVSLLPQSIVQRFRDDATTYTSQQQPVEQRPQISDSRPDTTPDTHHAWRDALKVIQRIHGQVA